MQVKLKINDCYYNRLQFYIGWASKTKNQKTKFKLGKKIQKEMADLPNNIEFD